MEKSKLIKEYVDWLYSFVDDDQHKRGHYTKLVRHLHNVDFYYKNPRDANRAQDGLDLRYRFCCEKHYDDRIIASVLDVVPCSVLEMLVGLSDRCEEHIMDDVDVGNRTGKWFWIMMSNLGLDKMTDSKYNEAFVDNALKMFMDRTYAWNGKGGLFTLKHSRKDLRTVEIWYQLMWYLNDNYD